MADIPYYEKFLPSALKAQLLQQTHTVFQVPVLRELGPGGGLETSESLQFLATLYETIRADLHAVLAAREADRAFIDARCRALAIFNREHGTHRTVLGLEDGKGRVVFGPKRPDFVQPGGAPIAPLPDFLQGPHVTLFGPPDTAKMAINAVNAFHRQLPKEPPIIAELLRDCTFLPKWGADDEDSKTPIRKDLISAGMNLSGCYDGSLRTVDEASGKTYAIHPESQTLPIKRFPGLALPCPFLFHGDNPIPLHLYDFALHVFHNWEHPRALTFYVPKLENEEEARYIHRMVAETEKLLQVKHPEYKLGSIRLMIVLENPRAIFRVHEIIDALHPYFAGASLGWHDYLASTARLFKEDASYRIPSKSDPLIVVRYIKASHRLLADVVGSRGGIKVGGMYGVLPTSNDLYSASFQVTLKGYFRDVITQLKRGLTGFWVAHPDFVRIGLALVMAWEKRECLPKLVEGLFLPEHARDVLRFIEAEDSEGLDPSDPLYPLSLIVADLKSAPNHQPEEIRYNIFQSLQYLADWLAGNGCVALPASLEGLPVRVMDDLATTERSRWEVWHEIHHGRFPLDDFLRLAFEELTFIRKNLSHDKKSVQVKWSEWYPIAFRLMIRFMTDPHPVEFVSELLLPFTVPGLRPEITLDPYVERFVSWFERLGNQRFAAAMARDLVPDWNKGEALVQSLDFDELVAAAAFHGDIGEGKQTLDAMAAKEQAQVFQDEESIREQLREQGAIYKQIFGIKFLVSAEGKSGQEMLDILQKRLKNTREQELDHARTALWEIAKKRSGQQDNVFQNIQQRHGISSAMITLLTPGHSQDMCLDTDAHTWFEVASLSKSIASAFALEYFAAKGISLDTSVNALLATTASTFRLEGRWAERVNLAHLMSHKALNLHYVKGVPANEVMPPISSFLRGNTRYGYDPIAVIHEPGTVFQYSGAGFLVLEHLITELEKAPLETITRPFLDALGMQDFSFHPETIPGKIYAEGRRDKGEAISGGRLMFPGFAAGGVGTSAAIGRFLVHLEKAWHDRDGSGPISHDTARALLFGTDQGCQAFMRCNMGLGIFVTDAGDNRLAIHQGANDGFRCLYLYCYAGPDRGKGLVVLCNSDFSGVLFNAEVAQEALRLFQMQGVDFSAFEQGFDPSRLKPEEVVNIGYRDLVFKAFQPRLPEPILQKGPRSPLADSNLVTGARISDVSNQLFGRAENLISPHDPVFDPGLFGKEGKIMDSWETVRHNSKPFDSLIMDLKKPGKIRYISISTRYHLGNQAASIRLEGCSEGQWSEILPGTPLNGHSLLRIDRDVDEKIYARVRVQIYPDGGLTRLGLFTDLPTSEAIHYNSISSVFDESIPQTRKPLSLPFTVDTTLRLPVKGQLTNVASAALGAKVLRASNEHYGPAIQVISPYRPLHMFDGLESARSRQPNHHEEVVVQLAKPSVISSIVVDFTFFVNNNPRDLSIQAQVGDEWVELVPRTRVKEFASSQKSFSIKDARGFSVLRVQTFPDGGLNRLLVFSPW